MPDARWFEDRRHKVHVSRSRLAPIVITTDTIVSVIPKRISNINSNVDLRWPVMFFSVPRHFQIPCLTYRRQQATRMVIPPFRALRLWRGFVIGTNSIPLQGRAVRWWRPLNLFPIGRRHTGFPTGAVSRDTRGV